MKNNTRIYRAACLVCLAVISSSSAFAQSFELLGDRCYNPNNWDFPGAAEIYLDSNGDLFTLVDEASQPRDPELAEYSFGTGTWADLSQGGFVVPGGQSTLDGVGMPDGSVLAAMRTFDNEVYVVHYMPDGTMSNVGNNPLLVNPNILSITIGVAPNGDIYVAGGQLEGSAFFQKWDGTDWAEQAAFTTEVNRNHSMAIDENGKVYLTYEEVISGAVRIKVDTYTEASGWENILSETNISGDGELLIESATEVYTIYHRSEGSNAFVIKRYDGTDWEDIGNSIAYDEDDCSKGSLEKLDASGDLYMSNCDGLFRFDSNTNSWNEIANTIADGGAISGFGTKLLESSNGTLINVFLCSAFNGLDAVEFTPLNVGVDEYSVSDQISVHPNPASSIVTISDGGASLESIRIYSLSGKSIYNEEVDGHATNSRSIDISSLESGLYILLVNDAYVEKLSIE